MQAGPNFEDVLASSHRNSADRPPCRSAQAHQSARSVISVRILYISLKKVQSHLGYGTGNEIFDLLSEKGCGISVGVAGVVW